MGIFDAIGTAHNTSASRIELSLGRCESSRPEPADSVGRSVVFESGARKSCAFTSEKFS